MDHKQLEEIGESLRSLGHERREVVERIVSVAEKGSAETERLYQALDQISEQAIRLMERQRTLIRQQLSARER